MKLIMPKVDKNSETYYTRNRIIAMFAIPFAILIIGFIIFLITSAPGINDTYFIDGVSEEENNFRGVDLSTCTSGTVKIEKEVGVITCEGKELVAFEAKNGTIWPAKGAEISGKYSLSGDNLKITIGKYVITAHRKKDK